FRSRKCDERIPNGVGWEVISVGHVTAKGVHNVLAPLHHICHRIGLSSSDVQKTGIGGSVERPQHLSGAGIYRVELAVAFSEKDQVTSNQHARFCRLVDPD